MTQRNVTRAIDNPVGRKYAARRGEIRDERSQLSLKLFDRRLRTSNNKYCFAWITEKDYGWTVISDGVSI